MWTLMALLALGAQHVHAVAITPSNSTASITTTETETSAITSAPSIDENGITINTCSYINTTDGQTLWNSPYCSMYAGTVDLIYWPTTGNHSYPSTFIDTETDYTFYSPSVYMIVNTLYGWNECGPLGPSTSRAIFGFDLDQVSTLVPYSNSQDTTTRRETRQLYLSDLGIDCDGNYNRSHLATQIAPVKDDDTRCNPFLAVPIEAKRWGYPYWKHCGIKNNKFGLFDPPYAVKPLDNLIPVTATTADTGKPKTTAASTKATAAPEPGPTKAEPSNPEPTKDTPEEEEEKPAPGKTEAEGEKQTAGGNGGDQGGKTTKESGPEAEKTNAASPNTPSNDPEVGAGQGDSQAGSEAENTEAASPSTPSDVEAGQGEVQPDAQGENTDAGSGSTPSEDSGTNAGQDGPRPGSEAENTKPGSGSNEDSDANTDEDENTNTTSGSTASNDSDADAGQDHSEDADPSVHHPQSPSAPGSDEASSSSDDQNSPNPNDGYAEIDPTEYSGRVVSTMTGEQIVRLGTAGLEIVDVGSGKTSTYAVPAAGVTDDQTTYAPATVAVYSGTTLTLGGPEITVTGAVVVAPHGSEGSGVTKPTLAVVGSSSANRVTGSFLGLGVSLLLVLWT
ncbi:hypothetical protein CDV36_004238 [Fusarium kuroshium]|uniref:Uncharacterized protein n=1 Tax=Fusarium kuroshium TaxID=2010991 RepID=A0A3M2SES7_9HYPO|nr:hypothetical protein CDV36_004238 [Fusarium kuroshium]